MAISNPRIVVGPTQTRASSKQAYAKITNTIPPQAYVEVDPETGIPETILQPAEREGQLLVYNAPNETVIYVVVVVNLSLVWRRATPITGYIDSKTGLPFGL